MTFYFESFSPVLLSCGVTTAVSRTTSLSTRTMVKMKTLTSTTSMGWVLLSVVFASVLVSPVVALWPQPRTFTAGTSAVRLSQNFDISIAGIRNPPSDLRDAVTRTKGFLNNDKLERLVVGRGAADATAISSAKTLSKLTVVLGKNTTTGSIASEAQKPLGTRDEAYFLVVPSDGSGATLSANSTLGLFRGLTTFTQLWYQSQGTTYALNVPINIKDSPAYVCGSSREVT